MIGLVLKKMLAEDIAEYNSVPKHCLHIFGLVSCKQCRFVMRDSILSQYCVDGMNFIYQTLLTEAEAGCNITSKCMYQDHQMFR